MRQSTFETGQPEVWERGRRRGSGPSHAFTQLLEQLEAEYLRHVAELQDEVDRLRNGLQEGSLVEPEEHRASLLTAAEKPLVELPISEEDGEQQKQAQEANRGARTFLDGPMGAPSAAVVARVGDDDAADDHHQRPPPRDDDPSPLLVKVTIVNAVGLPAGDLGPRGSSDPYCICRVPGKGVEFQTPVIKCTTTPAWNYECVIVGWSPGDSLEFVVQDYDRYSADDTLCSATLRSTEIHMGDATHELHLEGPRGDGHLEAILTVRVEMEYQQDVFQMRPVWGDPVHDRAKGASLRQLAFLAVLSKQQAYEVGGSRMMLDPSSSVRLIWDICGILVLCTDLIFIPMQVFDPPDVLFFAVLRWISAVFWTLDMFLTCNTGMQSNQGYIIMDRREVMRMYARRWLLFDLLVVCMEWVFLLATEDGGLDTGGASAARAGKVLRVIRMFRILRLMRLAKMRELIFTLQSCIESEILTLALMVSLNMMSILALNHVLACLWYAVGNMSDDGWVAGTSGLRNGSYILKYVVSMQWTMAQFSPGSSPVLPRTITERMFSLGVLILGFIVATCFVSNITSTLSAVWAVKRRDKTQSLLLKTFLRQNSISRQLAIRVTRYINAVRELRQRKVHSSKVEYLTFLSGPLHVELLVELMEPQVCNHRLFVDIKTTSKTAFQELCTSALAQSSFARNDALFVRNMEAHSMYFISTGSTVYRRRRNGVSKRRSKVPAGHWFCENVLWMPWQHVGDMKALSNVDAMILNATKFCEVTRADPEAYQLARDHCANFMDCILKIATFDSLAISDLPFTTQILSEETAADGGASAALNDVSMSPFAVLNPAALEVKHAEDVQVELMEFSDSDSDSDSEHKQLRARTWSRQFNSSTARNSFRHPSWGQSLRERFGKRLPNLHASKAAA